MRWDGVVELCGGWGGVGVVWKWCGGDVGVGGGVGIYGLSSGPAAEDGGWERAEPGRSLAESCRQAVRKGICGLAV